MFTHSTCKKPVFIDVTQGVRIVARTVSLSVGGFSYGVAEVSEIGGGKKTGPSFVCSCCGDVDEIDQILCTCSICNGEKPIGSCVTSDFLPVICSDCLLAIREKKDPTGKATFFMEYLSVLPEEISLKPITLVLGIKTTTKKGVANE